MMSGRDDSIVVALVMGLALGSAAFIVDQFDGPAVKVLSPIISSSFSWGVAAVVAGYRARSRRQAVIGAVSALSMATVTYYVLILVYSRRWALGVSDDGGSTAYGGLLSIGRALGLWLILAGCVGLVLGLLGKQISSGTSHWRVTAAGLVAGLLAGEAVHTSLLALRHRIADELVSFALWPLTVFLAIGGAAYMLTRRGEPVVWRSFGVAAIVSLAITTGLWSIVADLRTTL